MSWIIFLMVILVGGSFSEDAEAHKTKDDNGYKSSKVKSVCEYTSYLDFSGRWSRNANISSMIRGFEGYRSSVYIDSAGARTIGYGHLIAKNEDFSRGISRHQASALMFAEIKRADRFISKFVSVKISRFQRDALVSLVYNIGRSAFRGSTLLKKLNRGDHHGAAEQFLVWDRAGGRAVLGLKIRRAKEMAVFCAGISGNKP